MSKKKSNIEKINELELSFIMALACFRKRKRKIKSDKSDQSKEKLESNLEDKYYHDKIKRKVQRYSIIQDYPREDGWMDYVSLADQISLSSTSVHSKIKTLVDKKIVESKQIKWEYYKTGRKEKTKKVYRLIVNISVLELVASLFDYKRKISVLRLKKKIRSRLKNKKPNPRKISVFNKVPFIEETDFISQFPKEEISSWLYNYKIGLVAEKNYLSKRIKLLSKLSKNSKEAKLARGMRKDIKKINELLAEELNQTEVKKHRNKAKSR